MRYPISGVLFFVSIKEILLSQIGDGVGRKNRCVRSIVGPGFQKLIDVDISHPRVVEVVVVSVYQLVSFVEEFLGENSRSHSAGRGSGDDVDDYFFVFVGGFFVMFTDSFDDFEHDASFIAAEGNCAAFLRHRMLEFGFMAIFVFKYGYKIIDYLMLCNMRGSANLYYCFKDCVLRSCRFRRRSVKWRKAMRR